MSTAGGTGHVIEYTGEAIRALDMAGRMTVSNMTIEAGARAGLIAPDETTFAYLKGREYAPKGPAWDQAVAYWRTLPTDPGAHFDTTVTLNAGDIAPMVTWGTNPGAVVPVTGVVPNPSDVADEGQRAQMLRMLEYMALTPGQKLADVPIDVVFIGSCTNGRIEDIRAAAAVAKGRRVAAGVQALVVPGSGQVKKQAEDEGLDRILLEAGFEWRDPCCSMCLGMNPDKLTPGPALRQHVEPQLRGTAGSGRAHAPGVAGDGRRRRGHRTAGGCEAIGVINTPPQHSLSREAGEGREGVPQERDAMDKFTTLTAVAAPLPMQNIDTDKVIPARFLKTIKRSGLGVHLFDPLRFDSAGKERPDFILNQEPYRHAQIIVAHENFGCGSSREHAPWALTDFGIRCIIAPSFGDIFYNNSFKNGLLPIRLPRAICDALIDDAKLGGNARITIDLQRQVVVRPNGEEIHFDIDPFRKHSLLNGLDDIGQTLQHAPGIASYEAARRQAQPWLPTTMT